MSVKYLVPLKKNYPTDQLYSGSSNCVEISLNLFDRLSMSVSCTRPTTSSSPLCVATVYDDMWYIVGKTKPFKLTIPPYSRHGGNAPPGLVQATSLVLYGDIGTINKLNYADMLRQIGNRELPNVIYVEVVMYDEKQTTSDIMDHHQIHYVPDFNNQWRFSPLATSHGEVIFTLHGDDGAAPEIVHCDKYKVQSLVHSSEYFLRCVLKIDGEASVKITGVDAGVFSRLIDFIHYSKYVYLMTDGGQTLQEFCREMLVVANRFLCYKVAGECARCIVKVTSKDAVFSDVHLLATHYNGDDKLAVISKMGENIRELQPEGKEQHLKMLWEQYPLVAMSLLDKLTEKMQAACV